MLRQPDNSQPEHLNQLRKSGLLYMNSSVYFSHLEHCKTIDPVRFDKFEGSDWIFHPGSRLITFDWQRRVNFTIPPDDVAEHTSIRKFKNACNIYCMYAVTKPSSVDTKNYSFGKSFLIILNTSEFLKRFITTIMKLNLHQEYDLVEYYDLDTYSGETGPFRKPSRFAFQNEFRLLVRPGITLRQVMIGSLEDITSVVLPLSKINEIVDLSPDCARSAGLSW